MPDFYLNNPLLKNKNVQIDFTKEQIKEYIRCKEDIAYFLEQYYKIVTIDHGLITIELRDYQKDSIRLIEENKNTVFLFSRQTGKTATVVGFILHYILFNQFKIVGILSNKFSTSKEIIKRLQLAYENLPNWLQMGVTYWNKGSFGLENGCEAIAAATSASAIRGKSVSLLYIDEVAHIPGGLYEEFFKSIYPTISSGITSKMIMTSTPNGLNHFYKLYTEAESGINGYAHKKVTWEVVPERGENWKEKEIAATSEREFRQEHECEFQGSSNTLIDIAVIKTIAIKKPIQETESIKIYKEPEKDHAYVSCVDVARGLNLDYSVFNIIDVTNYPFEQVAVFRNKTVQPIVFPNYIVKFAKSYNNANVLVEINDIGDQIANSIYFDHEYEELITIKSHNNKQVISQGFGNKYRMGLRMTATVKRIGCSNLKILIESNKLIINDAETLSEITTFVGKNGSFRAEHGKHDDIIMTLVSFAWMTDQTFFKDMIEKDIRKELHDYYNNRVEEDIFPFGFIDNGEEIISPIPIMRDDDIQNWF